MNRCVLYMRYSSVLQNEQSIEGQERVCREYCNREGYTVVGTYIDRATSASKDIEKRTNFLKMIKDAEKDMFDYIIVYKLDRFSRSRYDMATYKYRLKKYGVKLISATEPISDKPEGIILESVLEGMAEYYSAELSQKVKRGVRESAMKHLYIGGHVPTGYKVVDRHYVIDEEKAEAIRIAFRMYADGHTITEIVNTLNDKGYTTAQGKRFGIQSFRKTFTNDIYIGTYRRADYVATNAIEPIIDMELWNRVQIRANNTSRIGGRNKAKIPFLLSGKLFCGECGSRMYGTTSTVKEYSYTMSYYRCANHTWNMGCTAKMIRKDDLEQVILSDAKEMLTAENIELIAETAVRENMEYIKNTTRIETITNQLADVEKRTANLLKALEIDSNLEPVVARINELTAEKEKLEAELLHEKDSVVMIDKDRLIFWLESFRNGDISDMRFSEALITLLVHSVTVWQKDDFVEILIKYNLTDKQDKSVFARKYKRCGNMCTDVPRVSNAQTIHIDELILYRYILISKTDMRKDKST